MSNASDFVIENGVLIEYTGNEETVIIPDGVTKINFAVFKDKKMRNINIPEGVTEIDWAAFSGCENLESIVIPDSVKCIYSSAFQNCKNLKSVIIPDDVSYIDPSAFDCCDKLADMDGYIILKNILYSYIGKSEEAIVPQGVQEISRMAFSDCENLESVEIPDSVTYIYSDSFYNCKNLKKISIWGNPGGKFLQSYNIQYFFAPRIPFEKIKSYGLNGFQIFAALAYLERTEEYIDLKIKEEYEKYVSSQKKKLLPYIFEHDRVLAISRYAELGKITPKNFNEYFFEPATKAGANQCVAFLLDWKAKNISADIEEKMFEREANKDPFNVTDMRKLWKFETLDNDTIEITGYKGKETELIIPERIGKRVVTKIGKEAFCNNNIIEKVLIPKSVTIIGEKAFDTCVKLKSVSIPDSVTIIGDKAFSWCNSLKSIVIPGSVLTIQRYTFWLCSELEKVVIEEGVEKIETGAFDSCKKLIDVIIPNSVKKINSPFYGCKKFTIYASEGSFAQKYAKQKGKPFITSLIHKKGED